jgi:iron(III) transport system ATP-binding protein
VTVNNTSLNVAEYTENDELRMSVRPEAVEVSDQPITGANVFPGKVKMVQFTGAAVHTYVEMNDQLTLVGTALNQGPSTYLKEGAEVYVRLPEDQIRIVPKAGV